MDPKKRQALKDKATKGMKFTHESAPMGKSDGQLANTYEETLMTVQKKAQKRSKRNLKRNFQCT